MLTTLYSGAMDSILPVTGTGLSLEDALTTYYKDFFQAMQDNVVKYVQRRLPDMITFWQSTQGQNLHGTTNAAAIVTELQDLLANTATYLAIKKAFI